MRMLEEGGGGWLCERVKNKKLASNVYSIWTSCISSISHMHMSLLCARSVSPQQGCILGVWRVNRGSFFVSEWGTASFQPQPPLNGANQVMCCTASRYYMDVFSLSTGCNRCRVTKCVIVELSYCEGIIPTSGKQNCHISATLLWPLKGFGQPWASIIVIDCN